MEEKFALQLHVYLGKSLGAALLAAQVSRVVQLWLAICSCELNQSVSQQDKGVEVWVGPNV